MVQSYLKKSISYPENRGLMPEDKNMNADLYEITLFDKDEIIALGQPIYTFIEHNIIYYPIYLVKNDRVSLQIGLYEVFADGLVNIIDADGDIDLDLMGQPLLYGFVEQVLNSEKNPQDKTALATVAQNIETREEPLTQQTAIEASNERALFQIKKDNNWMQTYMENNNYRIIDNEGKGDCLFAAIRDGLAKVGVHKSVMQQRQLLAENATEDVFQGYKTIYQDAAQRDAQLVQEIKTLVARHKDLKSKSDSLKDRNAKQVIVNQADDINKRHKIAKDERVYTKSIVDGEFKLFKNVHNLEQFKALIKTCAFWGDTWAISTLERLLKIKIILFSEESFKAGDIDNVLTCGQLNDTVLEDLGIFKPDYYILTIYQGYHYQLISYKKKGALTFTELPYDIKLKVVDKCLEKLAGPYYIIPDFREFMESVIDKKTATTQLTATEDIQSDLFGKFTIFQFYSKSIDKPPGKGAGELIAQSESNDYIDLSRIPDWRKKLSNYWLAPFALDGHQWSSVEHYYQGSKFKRNNPDFFLQFSLDSGSDMAKDVAMAKGYGGKTGKYLKHQVRPKHITVDADFFGPGKRGEKELEAAQYAKFSQNDDLKVLLLGTKLAKLQHFSRGSPPTIFYDLMRVRQKLVSKIAT